MSATKEALGALLNHGGSDPAASVSESLSAYGHLSRVPELSVSGERETGDGAIERAPQPSPSPQVKQLSGFWVPVERGELHELLNHPSWVLRLYFRLRDETYRARWEYGQEYQDYIYFRGFPFKWIKAHTFLFEPPDFARAVDLNVGQLYGGLKTLFTLGYLDALHFGVEVDEEQVCSVEGFGWPVSELIGPGEYDGDLDFVLALVHMQPLAGSFVRIPKEAGDVSPGMLRLLVWLYLHATFRGRTLTYRGRHRRLAPGELMASLSDLERELGVHRKQVSRWAGYALRDELLVKIPQGRDSLWKVRTYGRVPR